MISGNLSMISGNLFVISGKLLVILWKLSVMTGKLFVILGRAGPALRMHLRNPKRGMRNAALHVKAHRT